jgi:tetratricopeptide (TPR) repeat protein
MRAYGLSVLFLSLMFAGAASAASNADLDVCRRDRDPLERIAACERFLRDANESARHRAAAYWLRGKVYFDHRDDKRAIADFGRAIRLDPKLSQAWRDRGRANMGIGEFDRAIADYTKAIRLRPGAFEYQTRGFLNDKLHDFDAALADYTASIRLDPKSGYTYYLRGITHDRTQDFSRALADFDRAIELAPMLAMAYYRRGSLIGYWNGNLAYGIDDYERALKIDPTLADARDALEVARREADAALAKLTPAQWR